MRIAIIGAGVSGLVTAWLLQRKHEITLFEANAYLGGHANTVDVEVEGESHSVDTGFIVYNEATYPAFTRLLGHLGVATKPSEMSFSVRCDRSGIEWGSRSWNAILARRRNLLHPGFRRMLKDVVRFNREARTLIAMPDEKASLGEWLCGGEYSQDFVDLYVVPMGAAIWSADPRTFLEFPALSFARFFANHGLLERPPPVSWRTIQDGSRGYVRALVSDFDGRVRTATPVERVRRHAVGVEVATADGERHAFDRVVLATHSDQALRLLDDPSGAEQRLLTAIPYQSNEALLHTDASVLPRRQRARASWNYHIPERDHGAVTVTYDMNRLQGIRSKRPLLLSLNARDRVDPTQVLRRFEYDHPVFDRNALQAQQLHARLDGVNRTHFCGAYWGYGFHEDGVQSALAVARSFGLDLP